jgi:sugar phosphate isomerase/epimerase
MKLEKLDRRDFIARSAAAGAVALGSSPAGADPLGLPVGIQLYSVKDSLQVDVPGTLKQLREFGFREVENYNFGGLSAPEFRRRLDDAGLACPSTHLHFDADKFDAEFADAQAIGAHYVVSSLLRRGTGPLPYEGAPPKGLDAPMRAMTLEDAHRTAELANHIGEQARRAGLQYAYHNHYLEFVKQEGGQIGYDILLHETDPKLVQLEIDCGWMSVAGRNPVDYFKAYPGRIPMIHVKDFLPPANTTAPGDQGAQRFGRELGRGSIDYRPIFAAAKAAGGLRHYFSEQEAPYARMSQMQAAQVAYQFLHRLS